MAFLFVFLHYLDIEVVKSVKVIMILLQAVLKAGDQR
jgi:hypothetical protein